MNSTESRRLAEEFAAAGAQCVFGNPAVGGFDGIDAIRLPTGGVIGWRAPAGLDNDCTQHGARLARIAIEASARIAAIGSDTDHSESWKAAERGKVAALTADQFAAARADANREIAAFKAADVRESVPPPLSQTDAVGAIEDREIRDLVRAMQPDEQAALAHELLAGQHPRVLAALLRSPLPWTGVLGDTLPAAWATAKARANPHEYRLREQAQQAVAWLAEVIEQAQNTLPQVTQPA